VALQLAYRGFENPDVGAVEYDVLVGMHADPLSTGGSRVSCPMLRSPDVLRGRVMLVETCVWLTWEFPGQGWKADPDHY
jgi:hypothetical protein